MNAIRSAAIAAVLSTPALIAASVPSEAAYASPYSGVGQQRNDAAISHVQNNIRSSRTKTY